MLLDAFLKLVGQDGESTDSLHGKEIEIFSFEQTVTRTRKTASGTGDKSVWSTELSVVTVLKPVDSASPKLVAGACATRPTMYPEATISVCHSGGKSTETSDKWKKICYYEMVLKDVYVARVHMVGDPRVHLLGKAHAYPVIPGDLALVGPLEEIDLAYREVDWKYKGNDGTKNITGSFKLPKS